MFFNKKYIKVNHNEEPEKTQAEEPKQEEAKEAAPVVETVTCKICKKELDKQRVIKNKYVCYECGYYFRVRTKNRIRMVADAGTFETWDNDLKTENPLNFPEYEEKVAATQEKTGLNEGVTMGSCTINGEKTVLGVIDARFMMGSMGHVVGERITRAMEKATEQKLPVILFCCSGGARMQEGIISLMQMAKTSAAIERFSARGGLYISVLTHPTTGGVTAASAIAALQEAGSKLSRDMLKSAYRAFARQCYLIIELMRQFYDEQRVFRITGQRGESEFVPFSAQGLRAKPVPAVGGVELGSREPVFDIVVSAAKKSTFSRLSQNETAKECYKLGFFDPANADAALAALEMMDFEGVEKVRARVRQNGTLAQQLLQLQGQMARLSAALAQQPGGTQTAQDTAGLTAQLPVAAAARAMNWNGKEVK